MKSNVFWQLKLRYSPLVFVSLLICGLGALFVLNLYSNNLPPKTNSKLEAVKGIFSQKDYSGFQALAKQQGIEAAYKTLKSQYPANQAEAHDFAHIVGFEALEQKGLSGLAICDTAFNYGCYHGFIEVYLAKTGTASVKNIEDSCLGLGSVHAPSCLHGIGHGLMIVASYNLHAALKDCDLLLTTSRVYCWDGVFMERITGSMLSNENRPKITEANLNEPCDSVGEIYKEQCFRNQVSLWASFYSGDTQKIGEKCHELETKFWQTCFESIGLTNVIKVGEAREKLVGSCQMLSAQNSDFCLFGEIKELLFEGKSPTIAASLCEIVTPPNKQNCYQIYNQHFGEFQQRFEK